MNWNAFLFLGAATAAGCYAPPAKTAGPSEAERVKVELVSQYCEEGKGSDSDNGGVVQIRMKIAVTNGRDDSLQFAPDKLRLLANGTTLDPVVADGQLVVAPADTKVAIVRFMSGGGLSCHEEMRLDPAKSLVSGTKSVSVRPIVFVAQAGQ